MASNGSPAEDAAHLLIVDDDKRIRTLLSRFLTAEGYRVSAVDSASAAWRRLSTFIFDLIVLDVMMPEESGLAFAARLRAADPPISKAPILMLTARSETGSRIAGLEAGADDYLGKPSNRANSCCASPASCGARAAPRMTRRRNA